MSSFKEICGMTVEDRQTNYNADTMKYVVIDNVTFTNYKAFSSFREKTYVREPERSSNGVIGNLDTYATFLTWRVKIDFSMMSIDEYRELYRILLAKNEFVVSFYDVIEGHHIEKKMYCAPDQFPVLYTVARRLSTGEKTIDLTGVRNYTIELIGTNNDEAEQQLTYEWDTLTRGLLKSHKEYSNKHTFVIKDVIPDEEKNGRTLLYWVDAQGTIYTIGSTVQFQGHHIVITAVWG